MPNADTAGSIFRKMFTDLKETFPNQFHLIENFGSQSYFSCMRHCKLLIGNTSSGITEAASFNKYVINLGDRQKGRLTSENVIHIPFNSQTIINEAESYLGKSFNGENIYFQQNTALKIKSALKSALS
jgi:GDP/UDP-N,N'-diacetylbacillosamine 2-epimerase (hydrolysing)